MMGCAVGGASSPLAAPVEPPAASVGQQELPLFTYDWLAVNGKSRKPKASPVDWPEPVTVRGAGPAQLTLDTSSRPYLVEVNVFTRVGRSGVPEAEAEVWACGDGADKPCRIHGDGEENISVEIPRHVIQGPQRSYATIQVYWVVPPEERADGYGDVSEVTAVWLYRGASEGDS
jgi:hypothetical protein